MVAQFLLLRCGKSHNPCETSGAPLQVCVSRGNDDGHELLAGHNRLHTARWANINDDVARRRASPGGDHDVHSARLQHRRLGGVQNRNRGRTLGRRSYSQWRSSSQNRGSESQGGQLNAVAKSNGHGVEPRRDSTLQSVHRTKTLAHSTWGLIQVHERESRHRIRQPQCDRRIERKVAELRVTCRFSSPSGFQSLSLPRGPIDSTSLKPRPLEIDALWTSRSTPPSNIREIVGHTGTKAFTTMC